MTITRHLYAYFEDSTAKTGKTGLTDVTFTVKSVKHSDSAISTVVNGVVGFEVGMGVYGIQVPNADYTTYDYIGAAVTDSTATTSKQATAMRWDGVEAHLIEMGRIDENVSAAKILTSAYDPAKTAATQTSVTNIGNQIGTAGSGLTAIGDTRIANLDAAVSTRSTYDGSDTTGVTAILAIADKLNTMLAAVGMNYQFTVEALENAPAPETKENIAAEVDTVLSESHGIGAWTINYTQILSQAEVPAGTIVCKRGDIFTQSFTGLGNISARETIVITIKTDKNDTDAKALIKIKEVDGVLVLNKTEIPETIVDPNDEESTIPNPDRQLAEFLVTDEILGNATLNIKANCTKQFAWKDYYFDVQVMFDATGDDVRTLVEGNFLVTPDVTRDTI